MSLGTRIASTLLLLLTALLGAALIAVSVANRSSEERAVKERLESNAVLLTQAANAVASDFPFRAAVADHDSDTLVSVLENSCTRVNAALAVLTALDGHVLAAYGAHAQGGSDFPAQKLQPSAMSGERSHGILVDGGKLYQAVAVAMRSPLPVAWVVMGFELDGDAASGLEKISGLKTSVFIHDGGVFKEMNAVAALAELRSGGVRARDAVHAADAALYYAAARTVDAGDHQLGQSLADARAPFVGLRNKLFLIAGASLFAFGWAAFWIARSVTRPLQQLTKSVDRIREGDYSPSLPLPRRDEIGVLAEGLQLMQSAVMSRDQSIRRLAYEDTLTGLMNRAAFDARLSEALKASADACTGVVVIDIHRFRRINEHLGYSIGDAVLKNVGSRLAAVRSIDSAAARLSADRFAAFARVRDLAHLQSWGTSLLLALADPVVVESQPIDISPTLGLALTDGSSLQAEDLVRRADLALERARRDKRPLAVYDSTLSPAAPDQLSLLGELRHALEHDELRLFFQPKIELATNRIASAEVLIRWQHPTRGLLSPAAFVPFAEQTGFIRHLTRWTLDRAIAQAAVWYRTGRPLQLAVNISAEDVADMRLDARVAGLLTRHQLPPALLILELTESGFIDDPARALAMLDALAALGLQISIDDFGTGYSSLSLLARMPASEIKIDRSFVQGLEADPEFEAIVRSAIEMGHSLGLKVVAEGIETESAGRRLQALGCDVGQGYFYAKPMPVQALTAWLEGRERVPVIAVPVNFQTEEVADTLSLATY